MVRFVIRRLLWASRSSWVSSPSCSSSPGSSRATHAERRSRRRPTQRRAQRSTQRFGLDEPLPVQFAIYLRDLATGNLGESIKTGQPVTEIFVERMPTTVELTIYALIFAVTSAMTLGIISAYRRNSAGDVGTMVVANIGVSIPVFVLGLLLAWFFAILLKDTPFRCLHRAA